MQKLWMILLLLLLPALALAGGDDEDKKRDNDRKKEQAVYEQLEAHAGDATARATFGRFRDWTPVTRNSLVIETRRGDYYLVDLQASARCDFRPKFVRSLDIGQRRGRMVSLASGDTIRIDGEYRCRIRQIRPLDMDGAREAIGQLETYRLESEEEGENDED